jgi:hypothetical protein
VLSAPALVCVGTVVATIPASAAGAKLIDFSDRLVPVDQIAAAGYAGAVVYVAASRPGANFDFKPVTRDYADALRTAGLHVVSNFQYGKPGWPTPSDYTRGYDGGVADAHTAMDLHAAAGGPASAPIFFSIDEDISADIWKTVALQWFRGINSVVGIERTGIYGSANACSLAIADNVIGHSSTAGHRWAWQARALGGAVSVRRLHGIEPWRTHRRHPRRRGRRTRGRLRPMGHGSMKLRDLDRFRHACAW